MYSYSYQGYLLYRDANSHSMTAIRINPETLEQDGTVALPGMNLQIWEDGYSLLFTCYVFSGKQKRNWERFLRSQRDWFFLLLWSAALDQLQYFIQRSCILLQVLEEEEYCNILERMIILI